VGTNGCAHPTKSMRRMPLRGWARMAVPTLQNYMGQSTDNSDRAVVLNVLKASAKPGFTGP
jgi:hypothetical protein